MAETLEQAYNRIKSIPNTTEPPAPVAPPAVSGGDTATTTTQPKESLTEAFERVSTGKFEHDFSVSKMISNILPDAIKQWEDLSSVVENPKESAKGMLQLFGELLAIPTTQPSILDTEGARPEILPESPMLESIVKYYGDRYDLTSAEGREKFQYYVENHPVEFTSDVVGILGLLAGGAGAVSTSAKAGLTALNANKYLKPLRAAGRVAEYAIDPGAALGRALGDATQYLASKKKRIPNATQEQIEALKKFAAEDGVDPSEILVLYNKSKIRDFMNKGRLLLNRFQNVPGMGGIGGGLITGQWEYFVAGMLGEVVLRAIAESDPSKLVAILQYPPPAWSGVAAELSKQAGRATQRGVRVNVDEK